VDRPPEGRKPYMRHKLLSDSLLVGYGSSAFRGALLVVLLRLTDCPHGVCRPSTPASQTVSLVLCRVAKSFAS
jgi:hypothetical protein